MSGTAAGEGIGAMKTLEGFENPTADADNDPSNQNISFKEKLKNLEYRRKCWRTIWLGTSFWALVCTYFCLLCCIEYNKTL